MQWRVRCLHCACTGANLSWCGEEGDRGGRASKFVNGEGRKDQGRVTDAVACSVFALCLHRSQLEQVGGGRGRMCLIHKRGRDRGAQGEGSAGQSGDSCGVLAACVVSALHPARPGVCDEGRSLELQAI